MTSKGNNPSMKLTIKSPPPWLGRESRSALAFHKGKAIVEITTLHRFFNFGAHSAHDTAGISFLSFTPLWRIRNGCGQREVNAGIAG